MVWRWLSICLTVLAVGAPALAQPVAGRPVEDPAAGFPLPTDALMHPAVPVPPRTSFQRPDDEPLGPPTNPNPPRTSLPIGLPISVPSSAVRQFRFIPRYNRRFNLTSEILPDGTGTRRFIVTGGLIVNVSYAGGGQEIEFATDDAVVWVRGMATDNAMSGFQTDPDSKTEVELYLTGNVVIRSQGAAGQGTQTLRASQVYYDVERNRAVALSADLEVLPQNLRDDVHLRGREVRRLDAENWEILGAEVFSSKLPSDPGLRLEGKRILFNERKTVKRNVFGIPYRDLLTGEQIEDTERTITGRNAFVRLTELPVFWVPRLRVDVNDPVGPLTNIGFGQDRIFGTQLYTTWDMYKLLALRPPEGHRWRLLLDYLSDRGPGVGSNYDYSLPSRGEGLLSPGRGSVTVYGVNDRGEDILGNPRGPEPTPPTFRGRARWTHQQEILEGLYFQGQVAYLSDKNFHESYFKNEFDTAPNQETFAYLTYQRRQFWAGGLLQPKLGRDWIAETQWFPKASGAVTGQSFLDLFVYNARASAGYAVARPSERYPFAWLETDQRIDTGRFNLNQELSLPFQLGAAKLAPYGVLDLTQYTEDLTRDDDGRGRAYGGGGVRGSLPFSRLYADASSDLFNVRGLYHKSVLSGNYFVAKSDTSFTQLPLLDRLNDDAVEQAYRTMTPLQPDYMKSAVGLSLQNDPWYNPQQYAIRRLVDTRVDTLDSIQVLQADLRQRLQTKRGYPGMEHTVDVVTLGLSASYFPQAARDNFGKPFGFLEYAALWNVGDRVSVQSSGWFEPYDGGVRYYNVGAYLDRPDKTNFYFGYRQTDPLNSKAVTLQVGYQLSRRYYTSLSATYDFGLQQALSNTFTFTRTGSDLTVSIGFTYNALVNNFGLQFMVVPNLVANALPGRFGAQQLSGR